MAKQTTAQEIAELKRVLRAHGIVVDQEAEQSIEDRADYIAHGSPAHATFLGLVMVQGDQQNNGDQTYTSPRTNVTYQLDDALRGMKLFPGIDPEKATEAVLKQLVGELEAGKPPIPDDAPPMWRPRDVPI